MFAIIYALSWTYFSYTGSDYAFYWTISVSITVSPLFSRPDSQSRPRQLFPTSEIWLCLSFVPWETSASNSHESAISQHQPRYVQGQDCHTHQKHWWWHRIRHHQGTQRTMPQFCHYSIIHWCSHRRGYHHRCRCCRCWPHLRVLLLLCGVQTLLCSDRVDSLTVCWAMTWYTLCGTHDHTMVAARPRCSLWVVPCRSSTPYLQYCCRQGQILSWKLPVGLFAPGLVDVTRRLLML